jgi:hypothetical protein
LITFFRLNGLIVFELGVVFVGSVPGVGARKLNHEIGDGLEALTESTDGEGVCLCGLGGGGSGEFLTAMSKKFFLITFFRLNGLTVFELGGVFVGSVLGVGARKLNHEIGDGLEALTESTDGKGVCLCEIGGGVTGNF